jgi:hypothetical protein
MFGPFFGIASFLCSSFFFISLAISLSFIICWASQHHGRVFLSQPVLWQKLSMLVNVWCWHPPMSWSWWSQWDVTVAGHYHHVVEGDWYMRHCANCSSVCLFLALFFRARFPIFPVYCWFWNLYDLVTVSALNSIQATKTVSMEKISTMKIHIAVPFRLLNL